MTDLHAHGMAQTAPQSPFSPQEIAEFQAADRTTATHIVGMLVGIFCLGVVGYFLVSLWCGLATWLGS